MPEITRDRCITPSFSPSTRHRRKLMDAEEIDAKFINIDWNFSDRLGGITVQNDSPRPTQFGNISHRLQGANLVICEHYRNSRGLVADNPGQPVHINNPV